MSASPVNAAAAAIPSTAGLPGAAPVAPAWGASSAAPAKPSDFASDLAHLMALLTQGGAETSDAELPTLAERAAPDATPGSCDAVSSLWAELGLALPGETPLPATTTEPAATGIAALRETTTPASASTSLTTTLPVVTDPRSTGSAALPSAIDAAMTAGVASDTQATQAATLAIEASAAASQDDAAPTPVQNFASLMAAASAIEPARHGHAAFAPNATPVDVHQPQAPQQIAETVAWHVGKGVSEVRIQISPEDLGPLDIQLKLDGDKVSVRFDMADSSVRDVVQTSLPNLASLLSARGLQLDQAQVFSQQNRGQTPQQPQAQASTSEANGRDADGAISSAAIVRPLARRGLLDDYA